jgi:hypothetical protein
MREIEQLRVRDFGGPSYTQPQQEQEKIHPLEENSGWEGGVSDGRLRSLRMRSSVWW